MAETTLTVPDVTAVVDTGLHKVARYDPDRAIDSLDTERISAGLGRPARRTRRPDAGRASSCGCGTRAIGCGPHREPEIARVDLAATVLDVHRVGRRSRGRSSGSKRRRPTSACDAALELARGGSGADRRRRRADAARPRRCSGCRCIRGLRRLLARGAAARR